MLKRTKPTLSILLLSFIFLLKLQAYSQKISIGEPVHFLALGDSYTIGQSVSTSERWPNQLVSELSSQGFNVAELRIIAQTGWRTDNLQSAISQLLPLTGYNLVSLLIGVNNQFQGGSIQTYTQQFDDLLQQAIWLAGNDPRHVFVLSIPDYAYTPFGGGNSAISAAIDEFNSVNRFITETYNVRYIDITPISRKGLEDPSLVAIDGLHPSGKMYGLWVQEIVRYIEKEVGINENIEAIRDVSITVNDRNLYIHSPLYPAGFKIYSGTGKLLMSGEITGEENTVNLVNLPRGIYFIRLVAENRAGRTKKVILN
jgi:lysophospholipase L1-like esterase